MNFSSLKIFLIKACKTRNGTLCIFKIDICNSHWLSFSSFPQRNFNFFNFTINFKKFIELIMSYIIWKIHYVQSMLLNFFLIFFNIIIYYFLLFLFLFHNFYFFICLHEIHKTIIPCFLSSYFFLFFIFWILNVIIYSHYF